MNRFRVGITFLSGEDRTVAVLDSFGEARLMADAIAGFEPWIEWGQLPGTKLDSVEGELRWRRLTFTSDEKRRIEEIYLTARTELREGGMSAERIDSLLPLAVDGSVPWD